MKMSGHPLFKHVDVIKWKHFPRYWPSVRWIPRSPVNSPLKGQWRWALMFSFICARINGWVNNRKACDLRRHRAHYDVIVKCPQYMQRNWWQTAATPHMGFRLLKAIFITENILILQKFPWILFSTLFLIWKSSPVWIHGLATKKR